MYISHLIRMFVIAFVCLQTLAAQSAEFHGLGTLPDFIHSSASDISADGTVVVGQTRKDAIGSQQAFRWTETGGMEGLGYLPGATESVAVGVSADGLVVVGYSSGPNNRQAIRWTEMGGMEGLGFPPDTYSDARDVSADGTVIVGNVVSQSLDRQPFRWTESGGIENLGLLPFADYCRANGVSADGSVVVGSCSSIDCTSEICSVGDEEAFRWTEASGMEGLGSLPFGYTINSKAYGVSADGTVIVGGSAREAFRWTEAGGINGLGFLPARTSSFARGTSIDGKVAVGSSYSDYRERQAFRWTEVGSIESIPNILWRNGVDLTGWQLTDAIAANRDGSVIIGGGTHKGKDEAWIVYLGDISPVPTNPTDVRGTIKTADGDDICAIVLVSGHSMLTCRSYGSFSFNDIPRENNEAVKRQIYADGFLPEIDYLTEDTDEAMIMTPTGTCPNYNTLYNPAYVRESALKQINISGNVFLQDSLTPICAMVLANGEYMFSCDGTGSYDLNIPLDYSGQFKLQVYADGFAPTIQIFDEFSSVNDVRMARAVECR